MQIFCCIVLLPNIHCHIGSAHFKGTWLGSMIFLACEHHFLKNGKVNENSKASFHVHNSPYITRFKGRTAVTFEKRCSIFRSL